MLNNNYNSEVCLTVRCRNSCIQVCMRERGIYVINKAEKGCGQMLDRAIVRIIACCPAKKGAHCLKSVKIQLSH